MKTVWFLILLLAIPASAAAQFKFPVGTDVSLKWNPYTVAQATDQGLDRFEVLIKGTWTNSGLPILPPPTEFLKPLGVLPIGKHESGVRACNPSTCSPPALVTIEITALVPTTPTGVTVVPTLKTVSIPRAIELANIFAELLRDDTLTDEELFMLARDYPGPFEPDGTIRRDALINYLNSKALALWR